MYLLAVRNLCRSCLKSLGCTVSVTKGPNFGQNSDHISGLSGGRHGPKCRPVRLKHRLNVFCWRFPTYERLLRVLSSS